MRNINNKNKAFWILTLGIMSFIIIGSNPADSKKQPRFVAVADGPEAAYSYDGISWIDTKMQSLANWSSVCYGNGKFVAIASYNNIQNFNNITKFPILRTNRAAYSNDGIKWKAARLPNNVFWTSVCYGNNRFVAIAGRADLGSSENSNKAAYSDDGIKWKAATLPSEAYWTSVCYGNNRFVAVANDDKAAYSNDGINWAETTLSNADKWRKDAWVSVCYGKDKFVAIAGDFRDKAAYSDDGIKWTETALPNHAEWVSVCYGDGKFVAIANNDKAAYSIDGLNWTETRLPYGGANWSGICYGNDIYGNDMFIAINLGEAGGPNTMAAHSEDGIEWEITPYFSYGRWQSVCYGGD
ncbi:MAG: hypothetical protein FWG92_00270 [Leptospirales bacterium]|nr:hypothetical protein [Leptospirales bacterium]